MAHVKSTILNWHDTVIYAAKNMIECVVLFDKDYMAFLKESEHLDLTDSYEELLLWSTAFFYYLIDRWAYEELGINREIFMLNFDKCLNTELAAWFKLNQEDTKSIRKNLNSKTDYFKQFAKVVFPEKDKSPKGTLLWEFDKVLCRELLCSSGSTLYANEMLLFYLGVLNPLVRKCFKKHVESTMKVWI